MTAVTTRARNAMAAAAVSRLAWRELPVVHLLSLRLGLVLVDWAAASVVFIVASFVRFGDGEWLGFWQRLGIDIRIAAVLFGAAWAAALWSRGMYVHRTHWPIGLELRRITQATMVVVAITLSALFVAKEDDVSRLFLLVLFVSAPAAALIGRRIVRTAFGFIRERGLSQRHLLIIGTGPLAQAFADRVEARSSLGLRVAGHLATVDGGHGSLTRPVLGRIEDIEHVLHTRTIDEIVVCGSPEEAQFTGPLIELATAEGKVVRNVHPQRRSRTSITLEEDFDGFVVRSAVLDAGRELGLLVKRVVDFVCAVSGLVLLSPVLLTAAIMIHRHDGGPALFRQTRVGLHGRLFTIYKFRTMVIDADERFAEVAPLSETKGPAFKMIDDPRITSVGRFLRESSIDELPQLFNVLRGEMSLVGPRPAPPREVDAYDVWHRRRLSMKPGITGLWQVDSRMDEDFDDRAALDLVYVESWSALLDLKLLLRTVPAVFLRRGH